MPIVYSMDIHASSGLIDSIDVYCTNSLHYHWLYYFQVTHNPMCLL